MLFQCVSTQGLLHSPWSSSSVGWLLACLGPLSLYLCSLDQPLSITQELVRSWKSQPLSYWLAWNLYCSWLFWWAEFLRISNGLKFLSFVNDLHSLLDTYALSNTLFISSTHFNVNSCWELTRSIRCQVQNMIAQHLLRNKTVTCSAGWGWGLLIIAHVAVHCSCLWTFLWSLWLNSKGQTPERTR